MSAPHTYGHDCTECEGYCLKAKHTSGPWEADGTGYRAEGDGLCVMAWPKCVAVVGAGNPDQPQDADARLIAAAPELLTELACAHQIILNALNLMTPEQKQLWAERNDHDGVIGEGTTRHHEREAVIAKATGGAA